MTKKKKRKKLKIKSVIIFIFLLGILALIFYLFTLIKVRTFFIKNNKYLSDDEVLNELKLDNNSSFLLTADIFKRNEVKNSKLIKEIDINRNFNLEVTIDVTEYKMLYTDMSDNKVVLENGTKVDYQNDNLPTLITKIDDKKVAESFVKKMSKIDDNILGMVNEIAYSPNGIDKERFLFSMNDGNYVYLTLTKLTKINDYKKIINSVENKNGILYLDYGNYFVPKE
ncbi:MAG: FtsQ-type POTRA domain-containing protein [Bacilli bacterium]|nr:FtsQ-type POTRA domain-containing protein [Bacilli bacterium]